jgi:amidophosphoribosyltransferase
MPVPDSGTPAAIGFAQQANLPFELGIIRNHYVGRTFIAADSIQSATWASSSSTTPTAMIEGKRVVLVDDSIVRGTTSQKIVQMVREAGAREVHMRIASPPTMSSCYYGVDTPEKIEAARLAHERRGQWRISSASTASASCPSTASTARSREARATPNSPQFCDACFHRRLSDDC